jgi:hypothetical protein
VLNWFAVALVYCGLVGMLTGAISVVRPVHALGHQTRLSAVAFFSAAALLLIAGVFLPAPLQSISTAHDDLDRTMPAWQFGERHETRVRATPERIDAAIRQVTADDIALFRTLTWIRSPHLRPQNVDILHPPAGPMPILEVAQRSGFMLVSDRPAREIVLMTRVARGVNATFNFQISPAEDGSSDLTIETRVFAVDPQATRAFAAYWRMIYPGSALIRVMWLRAIRLRAEA